MTQKWGHKWQCDVMLLLSQVPRLRDSPAVTNTDVRPTASEKLQASLHHVRKLGSESSMFETMTTAPDNSWPVPSWETEPGQIGKSVPGFPNHRNCEIIQRYSSSCFSICFEPGQGRRGSYPHRANQHFCQNSTNWKCLPEIAKSNDVKFPFTVYFYQNQSNIFKHSLDALLEAM